MSDRIATIVFVLMELLLLALMAAQAQRIESTKALTQGVRGTGSIAWRGVLGVSGNIQQIWENYHYLVAAKQDREQMLEKINHLEGDRQRTQEIWQENVRLRQMLDLKDEAAFPRGVVARVVADLSSGPLRRAVQVDRGYTNGVGPGWVAVARGALVGRVQSVESGSSVVILVSDPDSGVAVRHQLDRFAGILRGGNRGPSVFARLEYVPRDQAVAVGDPIVTSGLDGVYPPGLLVGYVRDMAGDSQLTWRITVEVAADLANLEDVMLVPPANRPPPPKVVAPPVIAPPQPAPEPAAPAAATPTEPR